MGLYCDRILPHIVHKACGVKSLDPIRERVCAGLAGHVLEIGFGSGTNVPWYPGGVDRVSAVEPSDVAWRIGRRQVADSPVSIERAGLDGQSLPFPDDTFDAALSTWTLCTIPDVTAALQEVRRVLKPGGRLHFLEHGRAPDPQVRRWQRRLEPVQKRIAGGCHLSRPIAELITDAGFTIVDLDQFYDPHAPKIFGAYSLGTAAA